MNNTTKNSQSGFSLIEGILIIALVALVGFLGWIFYQNTQQPAPQTDTKTSQENSSVPAVNNSSDLKAAEEHTQGTDIDKQLDTSEIDAALSE